MRSNLRQLHIKRELEEDRRIEYKEVAEATGISAHTISRWMSRKPIRQMRENVVVPLLRYYQCELSDLVYVDWGGEDGIGEAS